MPIDMKNLDIEQLLTSIGIQGVVRRGQNVMACCPNHQERRPSWGVNINAPYFHGCFACNFSGTLPGMLLQKFGWKPQKIKDVFGTDAFQEQKARELSFKSVHAELGIYVPIVDEQELMPFELEKKGIKYLKKRGITLETMKRAGVLYHFKDKRVLFPWWWQGKLAGMTGRICRDNVEDGMKILGYLGLQKRLLHYIPARKGRLDPNKPVIIVEGEIDALKVLQSGFKNVVALGHGKVSKQPVRFLKTLPVKSVIIFTDNDKRGRELSEKIYNAFKGVCPVLEVNWRKVKQKDPGELSEDKIRDMIKNSERKILWPKFGI